MEVSPTIFFVHIPKTAGSTITSVIEQLYPKNEICHMSWTKYKNNVDVIGDLTKEQRNNIKIFCGHQAIGYHQRIYTPASYFTFLRNPVDRLLSHYFFWSRNGSELPPIEDIDDISRYNELNNLQTRWLSNSIFGQEYKSDKDMLNAAKSNLNHMWLGLVEDFDESLKFLAEQYKWRKIQYTNKKVNKLKNHTISKTTLELISENENLDIELYQYAIKLFQLQIAGKRQLCYPENSDHMRLPTVDTKDLALVWKAALNHQKNRNWGVAEKYYRIILESYPDHCDSLHHLGMIYFQRKSYQQAIDYYKRAISLNPANKEIMKNMKLVLDKIETA